MPASLLIYTVRHPSLTLTEFKDYYETKHIPLIVKNLGEFKPIGNMRYYMDRSPEGAPKTWFPSLDEKFRYDCVTVVTWKDEKTLQSALDTTTKSEAAAIVTAEEERFIDRNKTRLVFVGEGCGWLPHKQ